MILPISAIPLLTIYLCYHYIGGQSQLDFVDNFIKIAFVVEWTL